MRRLLLAALLAAAALGARPAAAAFGSSDAGTAGAQFLKLGPGARALGMGEAYSAAADEPSAVYWNPAALSRLTAPAATLMHAALINGISYEFVGYGQPVVGGALGLGAQYLSAPAIAETDANGFQTGANFSPHDLAVSLAYGREFKGGPAAGWSLGGAAKLIQSKIQNSASAYAVDAGLLSPKVSLAKGDLRFAAVVQNAGTPVKFIQDSNPLPLTLKAGAALSLTRDWLLSTDVAAPRDNSPYGALGTEFRHAGGKELSFAARAGLNTRAWGDVSGFSGVSMGVGALYRSLSFDYALVPTGTLGLTHRISIGCRFE